MLRVLSLRWVKAVIILERASKLAFQEPEESSEYARAHRSYIHNQHPGRPPPGYLEQPKYRVPTAYAETKMGLEMLVRSCGGDGVGPIERVKRGQGEVVISPAVILFVSHTFRQCTRRKGTESIAPHLCGHRNFIARYQLLRLREYRSVNRS